MLFTTFRCKNMPEDHPVVPRTRLESSRLFLLNCGYSHQLSSAVTVRSNPKQSCDIASSFSK